ncbi:MAG: 50S ribosomal protein L29 [Planctomycetota bacterium]
MSKAIAEIRGVDSHELEGQLAELRKEQFTLRFHGATETVARTSRAREIRRTIARILTVLHERGAAAGGQNGDQQ